MVQVEVAWEAQGIAIDINTHQLLRKVVTL